MEKNEKQPDKITEEEKLREHRLRMRFGWDDLIEEMIQEGQEKGAFENLRGKGKPLDLKKSGFGAEWDMAHGIMKDNKVLPPWIEKRNRITAETELLRQAIGRMWGRYSSAYQISPGKTHRDALALEWGGMCRDWEKKIAAINKNIDDFNLGRPTENLEIFRLRIDDVLKQAGARRELRD